MKTILEICAGDIASVRAAADGGADRVELCAALGAGGLTPSQGFIAEAVRVGGVKVHVLIRAREGHFVYTADELEIMNRDIATAAQCGAAGVVIGALRHDATVDVDACRLLVKTARQHGLSVTFHRAFDQVRDPFTALEEIIGLGCDRLLTSGLRPTALEGAGMLHDLNEAAANRIVIIAASGVNSRNVAEIISRSGCHEVHASARSEVASPMTFTRNSVTMGSIADEDFRRLTTDIDEVRNIKAKI